MSHFYHPANHGGSPEALAAIRARYPRPLDLSSTAGVAILTHSVYEAPDVEDPSVPESARQAGRILGFRSLISIPMLREGEAIGAISVTRQEPGRFSDAEVALLQTFADQAVIAIENVRLFTELQEKNHALTAAHAQVSQALEQQTATSEVLRIISSSPTDVRPVFDAIARSAAALCSADGAAVFTVVGEELHVSAVYSFAPEQIEALRRAYPQPIAQGGAASRAVRNSVIVNIADVTLDPTYGLPQVATQMNYRAIAAVPMLRDGRAVGVITVNQRMPRELTDKQIAVLRTFADQAVIAIENVRLFNELEDKNRALTEALEQQTATSEVLRVIAGSPTDVQPVFATIMENALRLCSAQTAAVLTFDGHMIHAGAFLNIPADAEEQMRRLFPRVPDRSSAAGRAILTSDVAEIPDVEADPDYAFASAVRAGGFRSNTAVPMLRDGRAVGTINLARTVAGRFSESEIALLKTFAHQAVIAIENVRMFNELQQKNRALTEALEQQTATAEILRIISQSQTEVRPVFAAILECAVRLCGADLGGVGTIEQGHIAVVDCYPSTPEQWEAVREHYPRPVDTTSLWGRAAVERRIIHVPDVNDPAAPESLARLNRMVGVRGQLRSARPGWTGRWGGGDLRDRHGTRHRARGP